MHCTLSNAEYRRLLSTLHKAQASGNQERILKTAQEGLDVFSQKGYPDRWFEWKNAKENALRLLRH